MKIHLPQNWLSVAFLCTLVVLAVFAPVLAPYGFNEQDYTAILAPPSADYWLGTDHIGRDVLSRLLYGARVSLLSALVAVLVATAIGVPVGFFAGVTGGWVDSIAMRMVDVLLAFPTIIMAIAITAIIGAGMGNAMIAVGVVLAPNFARLSRAQALTVKGLLYVDASRTFGAKRLWLIVRHIVPNAIQPVVVLTAHMLGIALLVEASLSFLGLGTPPPQPSWGGMLREASRYLTGISPQIVAPGLAIALTLLSINVLGDIARDILDPRNPRSLRRRPAAR